MTYTTYKDSLTKLRKRFVLADYLELRSNYPKQDPDINVLINQKDEATFRLYSIMMTQKLWEEMEKFSIDYDLYLDAVFGDVKAIDQVSLEILTAIQFKEGKRKNDEEDDEVYSVAHGNVISPALIVFLVGHLIEAVSVYKLRIPNSFKILININNNFYKSTFLTKNEKLAKKFECAHIEAANPGVTCRELAVLSGVEFSTVAKWQKNDAEYKAQFEMATALEDGSFTFREHGMELFKVLRIPIELLEKC